MRDPIDQSPRPVRRSELTCPGHSLKMITKASQSQADEVILDLEDACAPSQKVEARKVVVEALTSLDFGSRVRAVRVNDTRSPFFYRDLVDVVEAAGARLDALVIPKVDEAVDVQIVDRLLTQIERARGLPVGRIALEALLESAKGILHAEAIALSSPRLQSLIFGIADYAGDVGARALPEGDEQWTTYHFAKAQLLAAARAAGLDALDNVTVKYKDLAQCQADAEQGARMGFDGKWAIHPDQAPIINAAYTPTPEEIERARRIVETYARADVEEAGAIAIGDEMVDAASLRVERKKLRIAERAGHS